jgi:hypothetical protein
MTAFEKVCEALLIHRDASVYDQARAVLAAMREPTEEMIVAGFQACVGRKVGTFELAKAVGAESYRAMIDAAATEPKT